MVSHLEIRWLFQIWLHVTVLSPWWGAVSLLYLRIGLLNSPLLANKTFLLADRPKRKFNSSSTINTNYDSKIMISLATFKNGISTELSKVDNVWPCWQTLQLSKVSCSWTCQPQDYLISTLVPLKTIYDVWRRTASVELWVLWALINYIDQITKTSP